MKKPKFTWSEKDNAGYLSLKENKTNEIWRTNSYNVGKYMISVDYSEKDEVYGIEILKIKK